MAILRIVGVVAVLMCLAALMEMAGSLIDQVQALEAPMVSEDVIRVTVERGQKRVLLDLTMTPADYLVCLDADCGFPFDWARRADERAAR